MNNMLISVLMPAFNAEKFIKEAVISILNQTYENWELLIFDDSSTDKTLEIARSFKDDRIKVYTDKVNRKKPTVVNELFRLSKGELITVHDADDVSLPSRFEKIVNLFKNRADVYMCGHSIERISLKGKRLKLYRKKVEDYEDIKRLMEVSNTDGDPSLFIKREVIENIGQVFRPYFQNNMDYDLALRVIEKYKTTNLPEVLSLYRNVSSSISKNVKTYHKLVTHKLTKQFAKQRQSYGKDLLQKGDLESIRILEDEFSRPYEVDKTLHFREMAAFFMYCKMNFSAIYYMVKAVQTEPLKFKNWKTLQYCLRKTILKI